MSHPFTYIESDYDMNRVPIHHIYCQKHGFLRDERSLEEAIKFADEHDRIQHYGSKFHDEQA